MSNKQILFAIGSFALAALATASVSHADDPVFNRYVDLTLLPSAIATSDSALLTDLGMQTAFGESVLERPHRDVSATELATLALRLAMETRDMSSLDRLDKLAKKMGSEQLAAQIVGAKKLAGAARAPATTVGLDEVDSCDIANFQEAQHIIRTASLLGSRELLEDARESIEKFELPSSLNDKATQAAEEALAALPEGSSSPKIVETLELLANASREVAPSGIYSRVLQAYVTYDSEYQEFQIERVSRSSPLARYVRVGDWLVSFDSEYMKSVSDLDRRVKGATNVEIDNGSDRTKTVKVDFGTQQSAPVKPVPTSNNNGSWQTDMRGIKRWVPSGYYMCPKCTKLHPVR